MSKINKSLSLLTLLTAVVLLTGCHSSDYSTDIRMDSQQYAFRKNVMFLTEDHVSHITEVNENIIVFAPATPKDLLPSKKSVIIQQDCNTSYKTLTNRKITSIKKKKKGYVCKTKPAYLDNIYVDPSLVNTLGWNY